ncbi:hypothetical protein ACFXG6_05515 [Streptomyces roseus]|uniref:hypothetical protein n=1 Tax=Streptomyces roseus TaxID=66430 RepID=UPI0036A6F904
MTTELSTDDRTKARWDEGQVDGVGDPERRCLGHREQQAGHGSEDDERLARVHTETVCLAVALVLGVRVLGEVAAVAMWAATDTAIDRPTAHDKAPAEGAWASATPAGRSSTHHR